jgi:hypothetical protein
MFTVLNMLTCVPHFNRPGFPWQAALRLWFLGRVPISLPLNSVIRADQMAIQMEGWLNAYREGGYLSSWTAPGDRGAMTGNTQDASVADTIVKNVKGFDAALAYQAIVGDTFNVSCRNRAAASQGIARALASTSASGTPPPGTVSRMGCMRRSTTHWQAEACRLPPPT